MQNHRILKFGAVGTVIAALWCYTSVLVVLFGAVGLSAMVGMLDVILFLALAVFIGITVYASVKRARP